MFRLGGRDDDTVTLPTSGPGTMSRTSFYYLRATICVTICSVRRFRIATRFDTRTLLRRYRCTPDELHP